MAVTPYPFLAGATLTASQLNSTFNVPINAQTVSYVLVAADAGKRVQMNAAGSTTITVNTGLFQAGDSLFIQNINATGTTTVTAGSCTVTTASSLALAPFGGGTLYFTSASAAIFFSQVAVSYGTATGGTTLTPWATGGFNYNGLRFDADGTLTVTKAGLFDVMLIGGGGGGGSGQGAVPARGCGGGGGGGVLISTVFLATGTNAITIGAGGAINGELHGSSGNSSRLNTSLVMLGGGGGLGPQSGVKPAGASTGGGFGETNLITSVSTAFGSSYGNIGGNSVNDNAGGGGGGFNGVGANAVTSTGGAGGAGIDVSTFNSNISSFRAAGGGGGGVVNGAGGSGVGGSGGTAAAANTASGGGGGKNGNGSAGGSGVFFIRFRV